tara:strand:- start:6036 stop:6656 length:621 start_codon:yes stop_codon:yes gene_type:complete
LRSTKIGIISYGLGNIASVYNACLSLDLETFIIENPEDIINYSHIILPGVGTFSAAMELLNKGNWINPLKSFVKSSKPLLGICLGMQLLFDSGKEVVPTNGLGFIPGTVDLMPSNNKGKIPHIGWNSLEIVNDHPILKGIRDSVDFYFVHSYASLPSQTSNIIATTTHTITFPSFVSKNSVFGVQFHPEKSQPSGLKLLKNFSKII